MKQKLTSQENTHHIESNFKKLFRCKFYGVLRWYQLDHVWDVVKSDKADGWYINEINKSVPDTITQDTDLILQIEQIDQYLRKEHDEDYCGIVYVDNLDKPEFIKVFDPKKLGTSCSIAKTPSLPKWTISKVKPQDLTLQKETSNKPKHWLGNLFSK